jgi:Fe-S-cluster-containing dehydrogenase component
MTQYRMLIDVSRCIGCYNCFLACRDEHVGRDHRPVSIGQPASGHKWIAVREEERGVFPKVKVAHIPVPCQQCADAPCIRAASNGAVYRRADGIVVIDPDKAAGQRGIVESCPYGAISWNETQNVPQKCTFCAHLLDGGWKEPRCVEVCPTQALLFGDAGDRKGAVATQLAAPGVEALHPEYGTKPLVGYRGLPKPYLVGEVSFCDQVQLPASGIRISLRRGDQVLTTVTDSFGDFEFDNLETDAEYVLKIEHSGYQPREMRLQTGTDIDLGTIVLDR